MRGGPPCGLFCGTSPPRLNLLLKRLNLHDNKNCRVDSGGAKLLKSVKQHDFGVAAAEQKKKNASRRRYARCVIVTSKHRQELPMLCICVVQRTFCK